MLAIVAFTFCGGSALVVVCFFLLARDLHRIREKTVGYQNFLAYSTVGLSYAMSVLQRQQPGRPRCVLSECTGHCTVLAALQVHTVYGSVHMR